MQEVATRLRPLSLGDILDTIFRLYRHNLITYIGAVALLQVPLVALQVLLTLIIGQDVGRDLLSLSAELPRFDPRFDSFAELPIGSLIAYFGITLLFGLVQVVVVQQLINGGLAYAISRNYMGERVSIFGAYEFGLGRMVSLIVAGVLVTFISAVLYLIPLGLLVGFVLLLIEATAGGDSESAGLALVLMVAAMIALVFVVLLIGLIALVFLFVTQAIVLEGRGPLSAMKRSWQLVTGSFWRVLGVALLLYVLAYILVLVPSSTASGLISVFFSGIDDFAINQTLTLLVSYLLQIIILPIQLIGYTVLYYDIRVRKEGLDLELLARRYGEAAYDQV